MADAPVTVYLTVDPLLTGLIPVVVAEIDGDVAIYGPSRYRAWGEGRHWHRTRWAAGNYAHQLQMARLAELRAGPRGPAVQIEILRLEALRFREPGR